MKLPSGCVEGEMERRWRRLNERPAPSPVGASGEYAQYLCSPHWRWVRGTVLVLADFTCAQCGGEAHEVHHKTYASKGRELLTDLTPMCELCHGQRHLMNFRDDSNDPRERERARRVASVKARFA